MIVALDTSTERASIALYAEELITEHSWVSHGQQTRELLPTLEFLLASSGMAIEQIGGVVVATGPGSFNGLRVGISTAKGLAMALSVPIIGVPTLDVVAYQNLHCPLPVYAVVRAGRGRVAVGVYAVASGSLQRIGEFRNTTLPELIEELPERVLFAGEITPEMATEIKENAGAKAVVAAGAAAWHRAGYLAEMGLRRLELGDTDDLASLQAIYLSQPAPGRAGTACG